MTCLDHNACVQLRLDSDVVNRAFLVRSDGPSTSFKRTLWERG